MRVITIGGFFDAGRPIRRYNLDYKFRHARASKTDRLLRGGIVLLSVALVYFIYAGIHERVVVAGDAAPEFTITTDNGRTVSAARISAANSWS